jgi:hypothetical protein
MLRILIRHAMSLDNNNPSKLRYDPSAGIKRPKIKEFRAWTDAETASYEARWPLGTKQRTAYALMLYVRAARVDVYRMTWRQAEGLGIDYVRSKTGVGVDIGQHSELQAALAAAPRHHVTIINTEIGKPFTVGGFSQFMRDAIARPDCRSIASLMVCARRSGGEWPTQDAQRTRSWQRLDTRHSPKLSVTRAMLIGDAAVGKPFSN